MGRRRSGSERVSEAAEVRQAVRHREAASLLSAVGEGGARLSLPAARFTGWLARERENVLVMDCVAFPCLHGTATTAATSNNL